MPSNTLEHLLTRIRSLEERVDALSARSTGGGWELNSFFNRHTNGGGQLMWTFDADRWQIGGSGDGRWNQNGTDASNYAATTYGAPYITLNGSDEWLSEPDATWQESGSEELFVFGWCWITDPLPSSVLTVAAKWDAAGDDRSWRLRYDGAASGDFEFSCDATGLVGGVVSVASSVTVVSETWYFIAGYYQPSTLMTIYVGAYDDQELTIDDLAVGVPASLHDGAEDLTIGATHAGVAPWDGRLGSIAARANVPVTNVDEHATMLFLSTADRYED